MENKNLKERNMYTICFGILAICMVALFFLSGASLSSIFNGLITGAVVTEETITQEAALEALLQAEKDMEEMQEAGFNIAWVNDALIEAKRYFEGEDYAELLKDLLKIKDPEKRRKARDLIIRAQEEIGYPINYKKVLEYAGSITDRKIQAYEIQDEIKAGELSIAELEEVESPEVKKSSFVGRAFGQGTEDTQEPKIDTSSVREILSKAEIEFKEERYDSAIELLSQVDPKIEQIRSENTMVKILYRVGKETTVNFIKEHYIALFVTLVMIVIVSLLSYNRIMVGVLDKRMENMDVEKQVLTELMKKAQTERYSTGKISREVYENKMAQYKERIQQIKQQLPVTQARKDKLSKMKRII